MLTFTSQPKRRNLVEEDTRNQSQGFSFHRHRAGRVGASISKAASHTNPAQPSQSLIMAVCYPSIIQVQQCSYRARL